MAWFDIISHARLFLNFFTDQPRNPWHMLAEPLGSAEPRLKNTGVVFHDTDKIMDFKHISRDSPDMTF